MGSHNYNYSSLSINSILYRITEANEHNKSSGSLEW